MEGALNSGYRFTRRHAVRDGFFRHNDGMKTRERIRRFWLRARPLLHRSELTGFFWKRPSANLTKGAFSTAPWFKALFNAFLTAFSIFFATV
jgi:hypothetical protein